MTRGWVLGLLVGLLVSGAGMAEIGEPPPPAVGRIDRGPGARPGAAICTGVLVAPDLVLTAGHCLRGAQAHPAGLRFTAGGVARRGAAVVAGPDAPPEPEAPADALLALAGDLALLRLDRPIGVGAPLPFAAAGAARFTVFAFRRDRPEAAPAAQTCARMMTWPAMLEPEFVGPEFVGPEVLGLDCPVVSGNSGAPLLVDTGEGWAIAGVLVAANRTGPVRALAAVPDAALRAMILPEQD